MKTPIIRNKMWNKSIGIITFNSIDFTKHYRPGQMCMLSVSSAKHTDPLLKRPFAPLVVDKSSGEVSILYAVAGRGTAILSEQPEGAMLTLDKPHGNVFKLADNKKIALIAGGAGIGPMVVLANSLIEKNCDVTLYYGARTADMIYPELKEENCRFLNYKVKRVFCTDDGSLYNNGFSTEIFKKDISSVLFDKCYTCGPLPMMKAVYKICSEHNIKLEVSLEEKMACGVGVCTGCMVKIKDKDNKIVLKRCCTEGPVFDGYSVVWE